MSFNAALLWFIYTLSVYSVEFSAVVAILFGANRMATLQRKVLAMCVFGFRAATCAVLSFPDSCLGWYFKSNCVNSWVQLFKINDLVKGIG